jgi:hypothetical protein
MKYLGLDQAKAVSGGECDTWSDGSYSCDFSGGSTSGGGFIRYNVTGDLTGSCESTLKVLSVDPDLGADIRITQECYGAYSEYGTLRYFEGVPSNYASSNINEYAWIRQGRL